MNTDRFQDAPVPADEPIGTPPAGGSWIWAKGEWVRGDVHQMLPDDQQPAQE